VLDAGKWHDDRPFRHLPRARQHADVAGRALEDEVEVPVGAPTLEERRWRGDEDEIDVVLGREPHGIVPGLGRGVRGDAGRCAALDESAASVGELPGRCREVAVVAQEASEDELARRAARERLREREQVVESGFVACDDHDRALSRCRNGL
jgi:hypothetical protein